MNEYAMEMHGIVKDFPGVRALNKVNFSVRPGEIHGLVGENGAGKSTLVKILMGVYTKDNGETIMNGKNVNITNPLQAKALGLNAIYQDVNIAPDLSVAENLFMGNLPKNAIGIVDFKRMYKETKEILNSIDVQVDPKMVIRNLPIAQQEMITIGKMIYQKAKVIIFDEPTALLANEETAELFRLIRRLKEQGIGIVYISHRLEEIFELCDRVTVLKDGETVGTKKIQEINQEQLITMMVGRDLTDMYSITRGEEGETVLKVENLTKAGKFDNVSFEAKRGQIFGMFGLIGSGRTDIVRSIFGADPYDSGTISIHGQRIRNKSPKQGIARGIALIPEDRKKEGLCMLMSVKDNTCMACTTKFSKVGFIDHDQTKKIAGEYIDKLGIKTPSLMQKVNNLSGGNQQKVVISKWLANDCDLFILDEPTVGVDVGAKQEIYKLLESFLAENKVIIIISSYLPEVMGLADRILVMYEGKQMGIVDRDQFSEEKLLALASGLQN